MASCSPQGWRWGDVRIASIRTRTVRWSITGTGAARGRTQRAAILVEVTTSEGARGLGEAAPLPGISIDTLADAEIALAAFAARAPLTLEPTLDTFARLAADLTPSPAARFAIETALAAALASARNVPLADLLAQADGLSSLSLYRPSGFFVADYSRSDPEPLRDRSQVEGASRPDTLATAVVVDTPEAARIAVAAGARTLKIKVGEGGDLERIVAIAAAAPEVGLRVDANCSWPRARVRERLGALAALPIEFVEEPCGDAHLLLAEPLPCPIALDESLVNLSPTALDAALASRDLGALILKPTLLGGLAACLALAARARGAGMRAIVTHAREGPVGTAACAELALAVGGAAAAGLAPHPALAGWSAQPPQLRAAAIVSVPWAPLLDDLAPPATRIVIATPTSETLAAIRGALVAGTPIALLHHKLAPDELARQRACVLAAQLPDDTASILFTSGSTGAARGVAISRAAIDAAVAASARHLGWRDDDRWLLALSTAHAGGLAVVARCVASGRPIELLVGEPDRVALAAALARCTLASLVPTQLALLLDDPAWRSPPRLRAVLLGGAAASRALLDAAAARGVPFLITYGLTETFGQIATAPLGRVGDPDAPLVPLQGVEIVAGTRAAPAPVALRGPMLATRYLDGTPIAPLFITADLGFVEESALHVVGRADDMIISGGENVHPSQVEAVLAATPGVRAACAFGVPDRRWGQLVGVAIAIDPTFDAAAAAARWHARLPPHARPRLLATTAALPQLPGGKIDRRAAATLPARAVDYA